jgi:hypothetical protein
VVVVTEEPVGTQHGVVRRAILDVDVIDEAEHVLERTHAIEDVQDWPAPSPRPTTPESARQLERATVADPEPRLDEIEIDDGIGI